MTEPSWNDLQRPAPAQDAKPNDEFNALCASIFTSTAGKLLLAELRRKHFDEGGNDLADDRALRVRIARQQFVRDLERARDAGLAAAQRKP